MYGICRNRVKPIKAVDSVDNIHFDDILYEIGLCLTSVRERPKRKTVDKPIVIFSLVSIFIAERIIILSIDDDNDRTFVCLGEISR